jgi:hypothetical protein
LHPTTDIKVYIFISRKGHFLIPREDSYFPSLGDVAKTMCPLPTSSLILDEDALLAKVLGFLFHYSLMT